ncbi:hypothetical protein JCM15764A_25740 [Geotalea toluenoxydans]
MYRLTMKINKHKNMLVEGAGLQAPTANIGCASTKEIISLGTAMAFSMVNYEE